MGLTKPIEQLLIKLLRYIYVSKRYYTREEKDEGQTLAVPRFAFYDIMKNRMMILFVWAGGMLDE